MAWYKRIFSEHLITANQQDFDTTNPWWRSYPDVPIRDPNTGPVQVRQDPNPQMALPFHGEDQDKMRAYWANQGVNPDSFFCGVCRTQMSQQQFSVAPKIRVNRVKIEFSDDETHEHARPHYFENTPICEDCSEDYFLCDECHQIKDRMDDFFEVPDNNHPFVKWCDECAAQCDFCGDAQLKGEMISDQTSIGCADHVRRCEGCDEIFDEENIIWHIGKEQDFCEKCYSEQSNEALEEFYEEFPEYRQMNVLENAANENQMSPEIYIDIFNELPWDSAYGGEAWGHIAETLVKLIDLRKRNKEMVKYDRESAFLIDHAFDLIHNSGSLFTKAPDSVKEWLFKALEAKKHTPPELWINNLSPDVRKLYVEHYGIDPNDTQFKGWVQNKMEIANIERQRRIEKVRTGFKYSPTEGRNTMKQLKITPSDLADTDIYVQAALSYSGNPEGLKAVGSIGKIQEWLQTIDRQQNNPGFSGWDEKWLFAQLANEFFAFSEYAPEKMVDRIGEKEIANLSKTIDITKLGPEFWQVLNDQKKELAEQATKTDLNKENGPYIREYRKKERNFDQWVKYFQKYNTEPALAIANTESKYIFKFAELDQTTFFDFYALNLIDCDAFDQHPRIGQEGKGNMCKFLKNYTATKLFDDIIEIAYKAVVREARHVGDHVGNE